MALQTTGYTATSPLHYLLDAGAIFKNLVYDETTGDWTGEVLGATSGGNEFSLTQEVRVIEVDGIRGQSKGSVVIDSETPSLTVNLKEITAKNLSLAIAGSSIDTTDENYDIITSKGKIELSDYLENIAFVGTISGSSKPIVITINNAIALEGLTISTQDKAEAVIPIKFTGHYDENNVELGTAPYKIYYPKMEVAP